MNSTGTDRQSKKDSGFSEMLRAFFEEDAETCRNCKNTYRVVWLKQGDDYNDFGLRHCPFCGFLHHDYSCVGKS